ncbi:MAG: glycoside hydrolase family 130 protein [Bacteroidetes bacterium]|nr:glycoside hydrolase family 130 protein [Bacteroidota bacterium]
MVEKLKIFINPNPSRVLLRFLRLSDKRSLRITESILTKTENEVAKILVSVRSEFESRHRNFDKRLLENYKVIESRLAFNRNISQNKKLLLGAVFSMEYTTEASALFNPSIARHPIQDDYDRLKFILSLRSTGEGHISSISFREGYLTSDGIIDLLPGNSFVTPGKKIMSDSNKSELIADQDISSNYDVEFGDDTDISERTLYPYSTAESMGMEDVRFVEFIENNESTYYGTYTAYNGRSIRTHMIETKDFKFFKIRSLSGEASVDKGLALFPRKIGDDYWMISRQDGESLYTISSKDIYNWESPQLLKLPELDWEITQIGNCGSPIELDEGWLLLTHGVGFVRKYVIGAILLDKNNPNKIIGVMDEPLLEAVGNERNGYVPNVVYSCGSINYKDNIIIPYAVSDTSSSFATVSIKDVLAKMK